MIIVKEGRPWFPDTGVAAARSPVEVRLRGASPGEHVVPGTSFRVVATT